MSQKPSETQIIAAPQSRQASPVVPRNQMRRQSDRGFNLGTVLGLLLKRRWVVVSVFALLFLPVVLLVATREAKYEAELRLMLKKSAGPGVASSLNGQMGPSGVSEADVQAEIELLKSRELYEESGRQTGVIAERAKPREVALAVAGIEQSLKITQVGKTNIISVKYTAPEPGTAAAIPNALAELYLKKHIALHSSDEAAQFFSDQTGIYQRQLEAAQTALTRFRQTGDVSLLQDQKQAYLRRATDLEAAMQEADSSMRDLEQRMLILERQRDAQPATVETGSRVARGSATVEKLKALLIDLGNKRTELLTKYDPNYRLVKEVDQQITDARAALERESAPQVVDRTNAPNPLRQSLESEVLRVQSQMAGLKARRSALARDLADYRFRQTRLESATANHNDLERAVKIAEENFLMYQRKLEEARLAEALDKQRLLNVAILEKAAVPVIAASQHRTYLLLFGFLAAAFLSLAGAFVADYLERHLPTKETLVQAVAPAPVEEPALPAVDPPSLHLPAIEAPVVEHRALAARDQVNKPVVAAVEAAPAPRPRPVIMERRPPQGSLPVNSPGNPPLHSPAAAEPAPPAKDTTVEITRHEVDRESGQVTTTAVVVRNADAWRELFDRRSRGAALARQSMAKQKAVPVKPSHGAANSRIDPEFLRRIQDKKTSSRDNRTGTRG